MEFIVWPFLNLAAGTYNTSNAYGSMTYPGAMRLLIGLGGEVYFTGDHYGEDGPQQNAYYVNPLPASFLGTVGRMRRWQMGIGNELEFQRGCAVGGAVEL